MVGLPRELGLKSLGFFARGGNVSLPGKRNALHFPWPAAIPAVAALRYFTRRRRLNIGRPSCGKIITPRTIFVKHLLPPVKNSDGGRDHGPKYTDAHQLASIAEADSGARERRDVRRPTSLM